MTQTLTKYPTTLVPLETFIPTFEGFAVNAFDKKEATEYLTKVLEFVKKVNGKAFIPLIPEGVEGYVIAGRKESDTVFVCLPHLDGSVPAMEKEYLNWAFTQDADEKAVITKQELLGAELIDYKNLEVISDEMIVIQLGWN